MHENQLLSPNRHPPRPANDHDGTILTTAPDRLWGTDASMVQTVADGRVWVFAALDHFNSEVIGHYVSTDGSRFAALEPISQAVSARFGGHRGRCRARRHRARRSRAAIHLRPLHPPDRPLGNGAQPFLSVSRKPTASSSGSAHSRSRDLGDLHSAADVRAAVATFVTRYNASWRLAWLGYMSPLDYRRGTRLHRPCRWPHERSCGSIGTRPIPPSRPVPTPSQHAQVWSGKAESLRASGLCLTEPSTLAISLSSGRTQSEPPP